MTSNISSTALMRIHKHLINIGIYDLVIDFFNTDDVSSVVSKQFNVLMANINKRQFKKIESSKNFETLFFIDSFFQFEYKLLMTIYMLNSYQPKEILQFFDELNKYLLLRPVYDEYLEYAKESSQIVASSYFQNFNSDKVSFLEFMKNIYFN